VQGRGALTTGWLQLGRTEGFGRVKVQRKAAHREKPEVIHGGIALIGAFLFCRLGDGMARRKRAASHDGDRSGQVNLGTRTRSGRDPRAS
jgi:hypothetical protein